MSGGGHYWDYHVSALSVNTRPRKMVANSQTTFWSAFSSTKMCEFLLNFYCSLFPCVQLTVFQHGFSHYLNQWWLVYWRINTSLDLNEWSQVSRDLTTWQGTKIMAPTMASVCHPPPLQHNRNYIENITGLPKLRQQIVQRKKITWPSTKTKLSKINFSLVQYFFLFYLSFDWSYPSGKSEESFGRTQNHFGIVEGLHWQLQNSREHYKVSILYYRC